MPDNLGNDYTTSPLAANSKDDFESLKPRIIHYYPPEVLKSRMEEPIVKIPEDIIAFNNNFFDSDTKTYPFRNCLKQESSSTSIPEETFELSDIYSPDQFRLDAKYFQMPIQKSISTKHLVPSGNNSKETDARNFAFYP